MNDLPVTEGQNTARPAIDGLSIEEVTHFVREGLRCFVEAHGADEEGQRGGERWPALAGPIEKRLSSLQAPLGEVVGDFSLDAASLFVLGLAGMVEADHQAAITVAKLQGSNGPGHPTLHLVEAMAWSLFGKRLRPLDMLAHPLVTSGVLSVGGAAIPSPFNTISVPPALWSILIGGGPDWPGVRPLPTADPSLLPRAARTVLPILAGQLKARAIRGLILRGSHDMARQVAAMVADHIGLAPVHINPKEHDQEVALHAACRYGRWLPILPLKLGPGDRFEPTPKAIDHPVIYCLGRDGGVAGDGLLTFTIQPPDADERRKLWRRWTDGDDLAEKLGRFAALDGATIESIGRSARVAASRDGGSPSLTHFISARTGMVAQNLLQLAEPITREVERDMLILPPAIGARFDNLITRCEARESVWAGLGPATIGDRNTGVHALFVGPSGTGKTLAVSHLATRLGAPLYRLDLSAVLNKFIGETEKNLSAALDQAADLDVILMMDEADALFGRRSDGGGEGERFGNMLTNFLLTRIETHPGIVILTANSRARIDPAFTRRLQAIIEFAEPGFEERLAIWRSHLGTRIPDSAGLRLLASQCDLAGGFVRTAVLSAAAKVPFKADQPALPVTGLARAAIAEYEKLGRTPPPGLIDLAR